MGRHPTGTVQQVNTCTVVMYTLPPMLNFDFCLVSFLLPFLSLPPLPPSYLPSSHPPLLPFSLPPLHSAGNLEVQPMVEVTEELVDEEYQYEEEFEVGGEGRGGGGEEKNTSCNAVILM